MSAENSYLPYLLKLNFMYNQFEKGFPPVAEWILSKQSDCEYEQFMRVHLETMAAAGPQSKNQILLMLKTEIKRIATLLEPPPSPQ